MILNHLIQRQLSSWEYKIIDFFNLYIGYDLVTSKIIQKKKSLKSTKSISKLKQSI